MKPYYEDDAVQIFHGDCREILPTLDRVAVNVLTVTLKSLKSLKS